MQKQQVVLNLLGFNGVGAAAIVLHQAGDGVDIDVLGAVGQTANGHVVEHFLAKWTHDRSPVSV